MVQKYAHTYILRIIIGFLFNNKNPNRVNLMFLPLIVNLYRVGIYSWGSACLTWLYRKLCRTTNSRVSKLGRALYILQIWA